MNEVDFLKTTFGKSNPFKVPEGYFENIEKRVMDNLPEIDTSSKTVAKEIPLWKRLRPYVAAAAFFGVMANVSAIAHSDDYNIDKAVDYVMMDNEDFYAYLAGE